ncbi:hypothetical protein C8R42DRAFT_692116 [Lentinula raphanica]|nr:hypothetical protein C8R42DRAFT_692116 [Lentinula raphanica]
MLDMRLAWIVLWTAQGSANNGMTATIGTTYFISTIFSFFDHLDFDLCWSFKQTTSTYLSALLSSSSRFNLSSLSSFVQVWPPGNPSIVCEPNFWHGHSFLRSKHCHCSGRSYNQAKFSHYHTFQLDPLVSFSGPGSMKSSTSLSEQCSSSQQINGPPSKKPRIDAHLSPDTAPPTLSSSVTSSTETTGEEFTLISDLHEDELADLTTIQDSSFLADCSELELGLDEEDEEIDRETHAYRLQMQDEARNRNSKKDNYSRHVNAYFDWIEHQQQLRLEANPSRHRTLTAEPITAGKVAIFLKYEVSRPKAKGGTGSVGSESISQTISALEKHRSERQHLPHYVANIKSHKPLRSDIRIKTFESAARRNEPLRALNAQKMKTAGPLSATYTPEELKKIAMSVFDSIHPSRTSLAKALRDRSMILMCSMFAFRGDSLRAVQLSDLGVEDLPKLHL